MPITDDITDEDDDDVGLDLDLLDSFLLSDDVGEDGMTLQILDGFLTAVAIGPELVMPSEWLPKVWGSHSPAWASVEQAEFIIDIIMGRYNEILRTVREGEEVYEPILFADFRDLRLSCEEWSHGFMLGVALCREAWEPIFLSETHCGFIGCIAVQEMSESEASATHGSETGAIYDMWQNGPAMIPEAVVEIDRFWKKARGHDDRNEKTGRNDPCPCGSGKKYKKCCGSN